MKKKGVNNGLLLTGRFRKAGLTFYLRQGQVIGRVSNSMEKRSNTLSQFVQRQKMRHAVALWKMLKLCEPMFTERQTAYQNFMSLANRLPAVYVPKGLMDSASFLMPDIPVSDGKLPTVKQQLGEVDGAAALITDLKVNEQRGDEKLRLYTAVQHIEHHLPRVRFDMRELSRSDMTVVNGYLALTDEEFADDMKGWSLVRVIGDRCSPQVLITRCTLYQQFTTDKALHDAAKSYGGLTESVL